jgi:integrase
LRVKDLDFEQNQIIVRDGKGMESRVTMLPRSIAEELKLHLHGVKLLHLQDLEKGYGSVYLPWRSLTINNITQGKYVKKLKNSSN